ncbi:MAG: YlmC/YmxH family sporulation protein [Clostridia bacterium]
MEITFLDLRCKEVINVVDGKRLGHIVDAVFDLKCGTIIGFLVPGCKSFWSMFKNSNEIFIPICQICKIGEDAILVELYGAPSPNNCGCSSSCPPSSIQGGK